MVKAKQKFRLGGIQECMVLAIFLSVGYLGIAVMLPQSHLPLVRSDSSEVFATFFLLVPSMFIGLSALELFWFERNLTWSDRQKKQRRAFLLPKLKQWVSEMHDIYEKRRKIERRN